MTSDQLLRVLEESLGSAISNKAAPADAIQALALVEVAIAINRLAATQEKGELKSRGAVHFSVANPEDQPDAQTAELRNIERERTKEG